MNTANLALLAQLALQAATAAANYSAVAAKATAEGRDATDEEVAEARTKATAAVDQLSLL
jgi:hypothetical protein